MMDLTDDTPCPDGIPDHLWPSIRAYVLHGQYVGSFLQAVIEHELFMAVAHADSESMAALKPLVMFFHNDAPSACHGSPERYATWMEKGGMGQWA